LATEAISAVAIICARNEEIHIRRCLRDLISQGVDVILIDHDSTDATVERAKPFLTRGLLSIERLEWTGEFSLTKQLETKRRIIAQVPHDWVIHVDADEWLVSPQPDQTLLEGICAADASGANAINFEEFVFVPSADEDFYYEWYSSMMLGYYFFSPSYPRLTRAWRRAGDFDNVPFGGHRLEGDGIRRHSADFVLRHYIVLSLSHARSKYLGRKFAQEDLNRGWYGRLEITAENLRLPARESLSYLPCPNSKGFSRAGPKSEHFWLWSIAESGGTPMEPL
jgi:glycosyltransferase involved in cell wall biosynthesis